MTTTSNKLYAEFDPEKSFRQKGQHAHSLSEDSSELVVLVDADGLVKYVSPSITPLLGFAAEEVVGQDAHSFIHPDDLGILLRGADESERVSGKNRSHECRLRSKKGTWRWFEGSGINLLQVPGVGVIVSAFRTIDQEKAAMHMHWGKFDQSEHFVQFYEHDEFLVETVCSFVHGGLEAGDACIVIATMEHRELLEEQPRGRGVDLAAACTRNEYISRDAGETLSQFMVDGVIDLERFTEIIGGIIALAAGGQRRVRIFGEMVALLWMADNQTAALHLKEAWNVLNHNPHSFSLFCAYPMRCFDKEKYERLFSEICQQHAYVIPDESYATLDQADERFRTIYLLQQKARSLEAEVAERKSTEEALYYLASIVESSDDAIFSKDLDGIITSWNEAAERMLGYSAQEVIGQPVSILFLPERQDEFTQIMTRIRQGERVDHFETKRVRKDGAILTVSVTVSPIKNRNGDIIGASDITRDITAQRRLETKFRQLFESNLIGVFVADFSDTFLAANDAFLDLLGYTRAELLAGAIQREALPPPESRFLSEEVVEALRSSGSFGPYEKEYRHKNGRSIPVLVAVTRIEQTDTCLGFVLDITERKELEKRKDEFIGMASHELKTPLTSLKGFLNLLRRNTVAQKDEKPLYYITRMETQVNKLTKLVNDLLDISRIQTGKLSYQEERFAIGSLIREIMENIQETTQTHHLLLEGETDAEVFGDRDRIGQVIVNLLNNAIKYSPHADTVLVRVSKDSHKILVSVQDFGIGIAKEHQRKIFERLYQITDPTAKTYPGLGIGLYISNEIVRRHGGKLWVESQKGQGSTFHFTLPLHREEEHKFS